MAKVDIHPIYRWEKKPFTEVRVWFHDTSDECRGFDEIVLKPGQLPYVCKDDAGTEYTIRMEDVIRLKGVDPELFKLRFNVHWLSRLYSKKRIGLVIMQYGQPAPVTHLTLKQEFSKLSPQGYSMTVKSNRYGAFLRSLIARPFANRTLLIVIVVIMVAVLIAYILLSGSVKV